MSIEVPVAPLAPTDQPRNAAPVTNVRIAPVTRVSGGLVLHASADFAERTVRDASLMATTFRGYEPILRGRDARDAIFISSRACGVCGGAHAIGSALAIEMACGIQPPATGIVARNFLAAAECMYDHPSHLFLRAGPDYSEPVVRQTDPELWKRAESTLAPSARIHGYSRMSDVMSALTRYSGALYRHGMSMSRMAREAYVTIGGKFPHPQTITPGGVSSTVDTSDFNLALLRIGKFFSYCQRVVAVWDDIASFFYEADSRYAELGAGPKNFLDLGLWDDPFSFDATYANAPAWGTQRWATPGAVLSGRLQTSDLQQIDSGVQEFVGHSFYEQWDGTAYSTDSAGHPLSKHHPYNKQTIPQPGSSDPARKYSWSTAARWNGHPMETGAQARMWATALAGKQPHSAFLEATGSSIRMNVPQGEMPAAVVEWHVPELWNAFERNRARAHALLQATLVAYETVVLGLDLRRRGGPDARIFTPYEIPSERVVGSGFWGGGRGYVSHHVELNDRVIQNYQIIGPSTFSGSPRDDAGKPGPAEAAIMATPLVSADASQSAIDLLRAVRSFDLCMYCAAQ